MTKQEILQSKDNGSTYIDEDVIDGDINVVYEAMDEWADIKAKKLALGFANFTRDYEKLRMNTWSKNPLSTNMVVYNTTELFHLYLEHLKQQ